MSPDEHPSEKLVTLNVFEDADGDEQDITIVQNKFG